MVCEKGLGLCSLEFYMMQDDRVVVLCLKTFVYGAPFPDDDYLLQTFRLSQAL